MLIQLGGFYTPEQTVVSPADGKAVRLTSVFDAEQLKTRMTEVTASTIPASASSTTDYEAMKSVEGSTISISGWAALFPTR
jgi:hypothetical protein